MPDFTVISVSPVTKIQPDAGEAAPGKDADVLDPFGALCVDPMARILDIQGRLMHEARMATNVWLDRLQKRHAANFEAAAKIGECRDVVEFAYLYRRWLAGALAQLMGEAHDGGERWMAILRAFRVESDGESIRDRSGRQQSGDPAKSRAA